MQLSNKLVYNGALSCATAVVAEATLPVAPHEVSLESAWLRQCISTDSGDSVVFVNTDEVRQLTCYRGNLLLYGKCPTGHFIRWSLVNIWACSVVTLWYVHVQQWFARDGHQMAPESHLVSGTEADIVMTIVTTALQVVTEL